MMKKSYRLAHLLALLILVIGFTCMHRIQAEAIPSFKLAYRISEGIAERDEMLVIDSPSRAAYYSLNEANRLYPSKSETRYYYYRISDEDVLSLYRELNRTRFWAQSFAEEVAFIPDGSYKILLIEWNGVKYNRTYGPELPKALKKLHSMLDGVIQRRSHPEGLQGLYYYEAQMLSPQELRDYVIVRDSDRELWPLVLNTSDLRKERPFMDIKWPCRFQHWVASQRLKAHSKYWCTQKEADQFGGGVIDFEIDYCYFPSALLAQYSLDRYFSHQRSQINLLPVERIRNNFLVDAWWDTNAPITGEWTSKAVILHKSTAVILIAGDNDTLLHEVAENMARKLRTFSPPTVHGIHELRW